MSKNIDAILFDMGGTLRRTLRRSPVEKVEIVSQILKLIDSDVPPAEFAQLLTARFRAYRRWAMRNLIELNESDLWTKWLLPDHPPGQVNKKALLLNQLWRDANGKHIVFPETRETVLTLFRRGYRLGLVSNTTSSVEVPRLLEELGIAGFFETVILSCVVGIRKPDPSILLMAAERMGVCPERCAYIGNTPRRDVVAAREAGFARNVILRDPQNPPSFPQDAALTPDHSIDNLKELLGLFPARLSAGSKRLGAGGLVYNVSLSSMWAKSNFPVLGDFFLAAGRLGFPKIELNHQVDSGMLVSVDLGEYVISSIHEPCPADIPVETLKARDWMISSPDEDCRQHGVASIKRTIELAGALSVRTVVVHAGHVSLDMVLEKKLRSLFEEGLIESAEYEEVKSLMKDRRLKLIGPRLEAVVKSLKELLDFASRFEVRLGLENRYHLFDIPTQDEMATLLSLSEPDRLGFVYDVGHAMAMDRLGFYPNEMWLKRFGGRIFGTHLHDVIGISDHYAPGLGEVDFRMVAGYLPKEAFRTIEVMSFNTPEQVKTGLKTVVDAGCVNLS
jgi:FMN phosphatase YigB (HAD superfamily)/sugar phosphate isomerase/epimerase